MARRARGAGGGRSCVAGYATRNSGPEGLDPATVRRRFQTRFGLSFKAYQRARRLAAAFEAIKAGGSLDDAVFDHGYESHSGFREAFARLFGDAPGRAAQASAERRLHPSRLDRKSASGPSSPGPSTREFACWNSPDQTYARGPGPDVLRSRFGLPAAPAPHPHLERLESRAGASISRGSAGTSDLPIHEPGTPFQERVWSALREIPYGETRSYGDWRGRSETRGRLGPWPRPTAAIASPSSCPAIASSGRMAAWGLWGGLWRKRRLLEIEGAARS